MEAEPSLLVISFILFLILHWLAKYYKSSVAHKLPPGPRKLPIIGNLHQLARAGSLPHHALRDFAHKYGPLMHLRLGEISTVVVSSSRLAREVMKTHDMSFVNRPNLLPAQIFTYGGIDIAFAPYGDYWRQIRKVCTLELLSAKKVQSFSYIREDETAKFIESIKLSAGSEINLTSRISSLVSAFVFRAAFGNISTDQREFANLQTQVVANIGGFDLADLFPSVKILNYITGKKPKMEKLQEKLDKIYENIVMEHREKRARAKGSIIKEEDEDLVDVLLRIQESGSLGIEMATQNIKAVISDVFVAGIDTSVSIIDWAMSELMKKPEVREKAQAEVRQAFKGKRIIHESDVEELSYLKLVYKETLRLHPPAPLLLPRECSELTIIDGYEIPVKTKIMVNVWAMGRDPQYWDDAEKFIPERFDGSSIDFKGNNFEYLPFGAGRRMCPGMSFGLSLIMLPLALLLYHFNWELPNGMKPEDVDMTENFGLAIRRRSNSYLIPTVYDLVSSCNIKLIQGSTVS
ncbi:cytochrome P450 71D8-like [Abrus precatorius]|uniref:Cytochrome P450 71D8-like n=1 Tax=Abrus precatorius TaxID=3816 RepID=A0A8B8M1X7_ABRPR|nr:cytochrome P450 71D8-like [Abrus precatorius]